MQVTLQQRGIDDLQQLFAALYRRRSLHEWRCCRTVGVVQLFHQVTAFLSPQKKKLKIFVLVLMFHISAAEGQMCLDVPQTCVR